MSATTHTKPVGKISIPASHMEQLSSVIRDKCMQNARMYAVGYEEVRKLHVGAGTIGIVEGHSQKVKK